MMGGNEAGTGGAAVPPSGGAGSGNDDGGGGTFASGGAPSSEGSPAAGGTTTFSLDALDSDGDGDWVDEDSPPSPDLEDRGHPEGNSYQFSTYSEIYGREREGTMYVPAAYEDGDEAPLMVVQDGGAFTVGGSLPRVIANLVAEGSIPPVVVITTSPDGPPSRSEQYDVMSDRYSRFITDELLPAAENDPEVLEDYENFELTDDPNWRGAYGCSSGAAAALTMAWLTNDQFRRVISYSGTFVNLNGNDGYPQGAWEYPDHLIADSPRKPLRMFLQVGEDDNGAGTGGDLDWVLANQSLAAALDAKGYHYRFVYSVGAQHCDGAPIAHTLPDAMRWVWRGAQQ